jgi:hypothetical protein
MGVRDMRDIRNPDRRLVCRIYEDGKIVEIRLKEWITRIVHHPDGSVEVLHIKIAA